MTSALPDAPFEEIAQRGWSADYVRRKPARALAAVREARPGGRPAARQQAR